MSLHAGVAVPPRDRPRLERLCRYVARPPLASERLGERADGTLTLRERSLYVLSSHVVLVARMLLQSRT